jgi:hypothetical protein
MCFIGGVHYKKMNNMFCSFCYHFEITPLLTPNFFAIEGLDSKHSFSLF